MNNFILATATRAGRLLVLDASQVLKAIKSNRRMIGLEEVLIKHKGIDQPRGIKSYISDSPKIRAVRVAGDRDVSTMWIEQDAQGNYRIKELLGVIAGQANHDVINPGNRDQGEFVLSPGNGYRPTIPARRKARRGDGDKPQKPLFDGKEAFINTFTSAGAFTVLTRRPQVEVEPDEDAPPINPADPKTGITKVLLPELLPDPGAVEFVKRDNSHDAVFQGKKLIKYPGKGKRWSAPHHVVKLKKRWLVCNSGAREIVDITNNKVHFVGGFPRGLVRGLNGTIMFCKSFHREEKENPWASIAFARFDGDELKIVTEVLLDGYKDVYQAAII